MSWRAVVAALDEGERLRSHVSLYLHPLAGRPIIWHVVRALLEASPPPERVRVLHRDDVRLRLPSDPVVEITEEAVPGGQEGRALRAAVTPPGMTLLVDGAAPLLTPSTFTRLLRGADNGVAAVRDEHSESIGTLAVAGEGPALASADDPRRPTGVARVTPTSSDELLRVVDRHTLGRAAVVLRDRLVRIHESQGVSFMLPDTIWVDMDVRIGSDTLVYPGVVIEGITEIGSGCVIGPHSRIVESTIGKGVELRGWNYIARTSVRNQAVLEPYVRRGSD
jgi:bifunctional N-acetylglucosamine-1-phosphate-uridyltransferase/glucosamine-1-phosphate-acetyltransferase GlmU-like protein